MKTGVEFVGSIPVCAMEPLSIPTPLERASRKSGSSHAQRCSGPRSLQVGAGALGDAALNQLSSFPCVCADPSSALPSLAVNAGSRMLSCRTGAALVGCYGALVLLQNFRRRREAPHVWSWVPFIGSAIVFGKDPLAFLEAQRARCGDVFTCVIGGHRMCFVCDHTSWNSIFRMRSTLQFGPVRFVRNERENREKEKRSDSRTCTCRIRGKT